MARYLDPQAKALLDKMAADSAPAPKTIAEARAAYRAVIPLAGAPEETGVEDRTIPGPAGALPVRLYTPRQALPDGRFPVLVYFHGGAFTMGDLDTHDAPLRALANRADVLIVAVQYRLAPEHPFPAAPEDCYAATQWVAGHAAEIGGDSAHIAVGGDSAGGTLAAVVALMARDRGGPRLADQVLLYPNTDAAMGSRSWQELADATPAILGRDTMRQNFAAYLPGDADRNNPYVSPLKAIELAGLPPAFVVTGGYDPLQDEGAAYAGLLKEAGVAVEHAHYTGMIHGFFQMAGALDAGRQLIYETAARLRDGLDGR